MLTLDELLKQSAPKPKSLDDLLQQTGGVEILKGERVPEELIQQRRMDEFLYKGLESGEIEPVEPTIGQRIKAHLPQAIGGAAGAAAALATFGPDPTDLVTIPTVKQEVVKRLTPLVGAGIGGIAGKVIQQTYRQRQPGAKPMTLKELYTEQLIAFIEEFGAEAGGRLLAKPIGAGIRALGKKIIAPGAKQAAKLLDRSGLGITIAQATDNRLFDLMESIAEGSLVGGGKIQKLKTILIPKAINKAVASLSDDFASAVGKLSPEEIGDVLLDTLGKKKTVFNRASRAIYKQVDNLIRRSGATGDIVDVTVLKKFAQTRLKSKVRVLRSQTGDTLLDSIIGLPDKISFKQASSLRSALITQSRNMTATKDVALGVTRQLTKLADGAINKSGKALSGDALDMWRFANKFHREGKQIFNSKIIKTLSKQLVDNPEKAVGTLFRKGATKQIKLLKNTVDAPTWNKLKSGYIETILQKGQTPTGEFSGIKFLSALDDDVLRVTFNPEEVASIRGLGKATELLQRPAAGFAATGKLVIAITQAGTIGDILAGGPFLNARGQATILLTPHALGRIATSKKWSKLLIEGMKDPIKNATSVTRLLNITRKLDIENNRRQKVEQMRRRVEEINRQLGASTTP